MSKASRTFRVFVSSTFSDLVAERDALAARVFPKLREVTERHGCHFQAVDLRWGVSDEAGLDQRTMRICLEELRRSQRVSPRPNFIVLLGERYGWRPAPAEVPAEEFDTLIGRAGNPELVGRWYRRDENGVPPVMVLQPRTGEYEDYEVWAPLEQQLRRTLLVAAISLGDPEAHRKYGASATAQEILAGALSIPDAPEHVFAFFRRIDGLPPDASAKAYLDLDLDGRRDKEAAAHIARLKTMLRDRLGQNVYDYAAQWTDGGMTTDHLSALCEDVLRCLRRAIETELARLEDTDSVENESRLHATFRRERARVFVGRKETLDAIDRYTKESETRLLALWGVSGSGKSALMAKAVERTRETFPTAVVVERFIAATVSSSDGSALLGGISEEISRAYDDATPVPRSYRELVADFAKRLSLATFERPLVVVIDALDQLSPFDGSRSLDWLPAELPQHARVVVSTLPGDCLATLERKVPAVRRIELSPLEPAEGRELLARWLAGVSRRLQTSQETNLLSKFDRCRLPLYLKLAFEEARWWRSYDALPAKPGGRLGVAGDVPGLLRDLFDRLADPRNHGRLLVDRSLSYLAASRSGLTEDELIDLLSHDRTLMEEFRQRAHYAVRGTLPIVVWSRLYCDLEPYLTKRAADETTVLSFYHRQVGEMATALYLAEGREKYVRQHLAGYFDGSGTTPRRAAELPYQFLMLEDWKRLHQTLSDPHLLASAWRGSAGSCFGYWMNTDARSFDIEKSLQPVIQDPERYRAETPAIGEFLYRLWEWKWISTRGCGTFKTDAGQLLSLLRSAVTVIRAADRPDLLSTWLWRLIGELNDAAAYVDRGQAMAEISALLQEQESLCRRTGDDRGLASALGGRGRVAFAQGDLPTALERFKAQSGVLKAVGDAQALARCVATIADVTQQMKGDTMESAAKAQAFAQEAIREKMSTVVRFPEIPIYIGAIYRAYGPPGPETMHLMMIVPERLKFRCSGCGPVDGDRLMKEYNPKYFPMDIIAQKTKCPFCGNSETLVLSYDPSIADPSSSVAPKGKKPWWKLR